MIVQKVSHYQIEKQLGQDGMGWKRANSKPLTNLRLCNPLTQVTVLTLLYCPHKSKTLLKVEVELTHSSASVDLPRTKEGASPAGRPAPLPSAAIWKAASTLEVASSA